MIYTGLRGRIGWSWWKNAPDLGALLFRRYPRFVFADIDDLEDVVPVFTFHSGDPEALERYCRLLVDSSYQTLGCDEFVDVLERRIAPSSRSLLLTVDDAGGSLWAVIYPLLKRYGLRATTFVVPGLVSDDETSRPNLDDVWADRAKLSEILSREQSEQPMCTWRELAEMHKSGVIDVESHTMHHTLVHVGTRIMDFLNPSTDPYLMGNFNIPMIQEAGCDLVERPLVFGRPVYEAAPRMTARPRYIDSEGLRHHMQDYVSTRGGAAFFAGRSWRGELHAEARRFLRSEGDLGHFESADECRAAIQGDLARSREMITARLGHEVRHLCFPWYMGSDLAVAAAKDAGYRSAFWGILPGSNAPRPGMDPFRIPRIDCRYLPRLPGPGRRPLREILADHFRPLLPRF